MTSVRNSLCSLTYVNLFNYSTISVRKPLLFGPHTFTHSLKRIKMLMLRRAITRAAAATAQPFGAGVRFATINGAMALLLC